MSIFMHLSFFFLFFFFLFLDCFWSVRNHISNEIIKKINSVKKWRNFDIMPVWKKDILCKKVKKNYWGIKKNRLNFQYCPPPLVRIVQTKTHTKVPERKRLVSCTKKRKKFPSTRRVDLYDNKKWLFFIFLLKKNWFWSWIKKKIGVGLLLKCDHYIKCCK